MLGIVPAAGAGSRLQPLAFSKEMLPVGSTVDEHGIERPKAVSEFLVERMLRRGADRICFVLSPDKTDILPITRDTLRRGVSAMWSRSGRRPVRRAVPRPAGHA